MSPPLRKRNPPVKPDSFAGENNSRSYPRYVTSESERFDPIELAEQTEKIVCRGDKRKYTGFYTVGVYRGIATGYACGCCLRCVFCWVDWSRDFPEKHGVFYTPQEAFEKLSRAARKSKVKKARISGAEPTIGKKHLLSLLDHVESSDFDVFVLETNGMLFGVDRDYVAHVSRFHRPHIRVSLKAGTPEAFAKKTGGNPEAFDTPFKAIENLLDYGASFHVASMSSDPRIMTTEERAKLLERLYEIDRKLAMNLEEEVVDQYKTTLTRLRFAGYELRWPLREAYPPTRLYFRGRDLPREGNSTRSP